MATLQEIKQLEDELRLAELGPKPEFFERVLSDDAILDGQKLKAKVVEAHQPGAGPKFTKVEMSEFQIIDHGDAAVITCRGDFAGEKWSGALRFMRVWHKQNGRWQIIAATTEVLEK